MINVSKEQLDFVIALSRPIDVLNLDTRSFNALWRRDIRTIYELCEAYKNGTLVKIRNIGKKSIDDIEYCLNRYFVAEGVIEDGRPD